MTGIVRRFRRFNRHYTKILGLLQPRLLGTDLSLAQARVLYEIRATPGASATAIMERLNMDRGQMSRIIARLTQTGFAEKHGPPAGRRPVALHPTRAGLDFLAALDGNADAQAARLLAHLDAKDAARLGAALDEVETLLLPGHAEPLAKAAPAIIRPARSGDLGWIIERHAVIYGREYGFNQEFEWYLVQGMAAFQNQGDPDRKQVWIAEADGRRVGSVGMVESVLPGDTRAQLRWLLVEPEARGLGVGRALGNQAVAFARAKGFSGIFLWTLQFLHAARTLYGSLGFTLAEERPGRMGGKDLVEELWELALEREPTE